MLSGRNGPNRPTRPRLRSLGRDEPDGQELPRSFGITPLVGWRTWQATVWREEVFLQGIRRWRWPTGEVRAECISERPLPASRHAAPDLRCSCGVYANLPEDPIWEWWSYFWGHPLVAGWVDLWGRIIRCQRGYRAEQARIRSPLTLYMTCSVRVKPHDWRDVGLCPNPARVVAERLDARGWCMEDTHTPDALHHPLQDAGAWVDMWVPRLEQRYDTEVIVAYGEEISWQT
jgi:hypothetical protein